ncbi:MAG: hypothetical protein NVS3B20_10710 [Polyangiales bacterium]
MAIDDQEIGVSRDTLLRGKLPLAQPTRGYRTNVDALWLAAFSAKPHPPHPKQPSKPSRRVLDLGSGVGAVGLALVVTATAHAATLLDIDADLLSCARRNADEAGVSERVTTVEADLRSNLPTELQSSFDLVVANPPYGVTRASRVPLDVVRARSRVGDDKTLHQFARAARSALGAAGRACFVYPSTDLARLLRTLQRVGLEPKRLRLVHPLLDGPASVALVEAKPAKPGGLRVEAPLIAMVSAGRWSEEAHRIIDHLDA